MSLPNQSAPSTKAYNLHIQRRARLQRIGDPEPFNGWVVEIRERHVRIRLGATLQELSPGDRLNVEVVGKEHTAAFVGEVVSAGNWQVQLAITEDVELLPRKESPRINILGGLCRVQFEGGEMSAISVDISE